jgi:hypothetical protein
VSTVAKLFWLNSTRYWTCPESGSSDFIPNVIVPPLTVPSAGASSAGGDGGRDILETERELARVQGELDAMAAQRKALANETEKILLHVDYRPEPSLGETGAMQPLMDAWRGAGRAFAESLAAALLFILQALPWLVIVVPVVWGVWKMLRRLAALRRARKASA